MTTDGGMWKPLTDVNIARIAVFGWGMIVRPVNTRPKTCTLIDCMLSEGEETQDGLRKRNLREELEEREWRHFWSKDKSYFDDRDLGQRGHLLLEGTREDAEDCLVPRSVDADDADVEV